MRAITIYFHEQVEDDVREVVVRTARTTFTGVRFNSQEGLPIDISQAFNALRGQFNGSAILELAVASGLRGFVFVLPFDVYTPGLNFVFGVAQFGFGCVINTWRLKLAADRRLFLERVMKTTKHELGHVFGLGHCSRPCVMRFANSLLELDMKPADFCDECLKKLRAVGAVL